MKKHILSPVFIVIVAVFAILIVLRNENTQTADEVAMPADAQGQPIIEGSPARFWDYMDNQKVKCNLCPHDCIIAEGERGRCRVRENRGGSLYSLVYGRPVALGASSIEKAPFHHFYPGHTRRTIATAGCNFLCLHCQNWSISQGNVDELRYFSYTPEQIIEKVEQDGLDSVSFTYTEPTIFFEYMYDIAKLAKQKGFRTSLVTNGFINPQPLRELLAHMDAVRVDLKAFTEEFYSTVAAGRLSPVLETLKIIQQEGVHLEIINLVIPTLNDSPEEIRRMCEWILENLGADIPVHFNRFLPQFKMTHLPPTPVDTLETAAEIAREVGLRFVYIGNLPGHPYNNTFCPDCDEMLIQRTGLFVVFNKIENGKCGYCGYSMPGVW